MMKSKGNESWNLESFLDSLIFELDRAQDTLAVKGLNRKLTYTVQDLSLELQIFPEFDGDTVRFKTAKPGDSGASKVSFQLGSIRDNQIREVTRQPLSTDEIALEEIDIPEEKRKQLQKLGIKSAEDLRRTVEERKVDLKKVTKNKVDYKNLANLINQSRRKQFAPKVSKVSVSQAQGDTVLTLQGENLAMASSLQEFPVALLNDETVEIVEANANQLRLRVNKDNLNHSLNNLKIALDPYAIVSMNIQG
ncbi:MAG: hypothetical protein ACFB2X_06820 [Rivularia sp. (in: cyanobacteria)]